jgi:hypothetical protein
MTVATLPPSNNIRALRSFLDKIQRTRAVPGREEIKHALDMLQGLETVISSARPASVVKDPWPLPGEMKK